MARIPIDFSRSAALHDFARIHDMDSTGIARYNPEVVRDNQKRHPESLSEVAHELQDLRLDGHVQRSRGLIGEDQFRIATQGDGDHHPLAHPAAQLVRIVGQSTFGIGDADQAKEL